MIISRKFQIWQAVANKRDTRTALQHVELKILSQEPNEAGWLPGTAAATDGWVLAVVPCFFQPAIEATPADIAGNPAIEATPGDIAGLISIDVLKAAYKAMPRTVDDIEIDLRQPGLAGIFGQVTMPRTINQPGTFPDWQPITPVRVDAFQRDYQLFAFGVQPAFITRVVAAIGCKASMAGNGSQAGSLARMSFGQASPAGFTFEPLVLEPSLSPADGRSPAAPFGLIMPVQLADHGRPGWTQEKK